MNRPWNVLKRLARSAGAGAFATLADLGVLALLTSGVGLGPRAASIPAFTVGAIVMYFGQKYFAFGERGKVRRAQAMLFAVVQLVGLALNAALFEGVMRFIPGTRPFYLPVRLVTTNLVWLAYSFPVWHLVFRERPR
ncbi:GtrA family protein [Pendulispora rubella]|uniref:GtrA family protein n=1 Tax=Pendulispora rubella TaxID=2741070 RepID=A0ABZ2LHM5_9BACT